MKYLYLIYEDRKLGATLPKEQIERAMKEYQAFDQSLKQTGHFVSSNMLDTNTIKTIQGEGGRPAAKDGAFANMKEQLGGYYVVEAKDLNEAVKLAERIPSAKWGAVEVRPIDEHHASKN